MPMPFQVQSEVVKMQRRGNAPPVISAKADPKPAPEYCQRKENLNRTGGGASFRKDDATADSGNDW